MKPRDLCEKAWREIAQHLPDFKPTQKGQRLKRISKNKDLTFEIYFQANRHNYQGNVEFLTHIKIQSKAMEKANINNGEVYGGELETLIGRGRNFKWTQIAGLSYQSSVDELVALLKKHILPIFDDFENTTANIEKILSQKHTPKGSLFYYIYFFGGKEKAQQYFNRYVNENEAKKRLKSFYHSLENQPRESIDANVMEFYGSDVIKFAFLNGIALESE